MLNELNETTDVLESEAYDNAIRSCRERELELPTFAQLADPRLIPPETQARLAAVGRDEPHPLNLSRIHWYNSESSTEPTAVPDHLVLPESLTGVAAPIVVLLADRFPMIRAHKVLATYAVLVPHLVTGRFDPTRDRAIWPSTGNYCRGGIAVSRIMGCRGVAVLPEGMSRERFDWLKSWVTDPEDIIATPGTESNVKEIYDKCAELEQQPGNIILNQFSEYGNYLAHYECTGRALESVFEAVSRQHAGARLRAFVAATGSAGTIGAGDYLKERLDTRIVAVEALECPTMLYNGFGEHNIQGIGDKHLPLIHNVMNTDFVIGVSDRSSDSLLVLLNSDAGREYLSERKRVPTALLGQLHRLGLSAWCNVVAAVKLAKHLELGPSDILMTIATDGAEMYSSEQKKVLDKYFQLGFDQVTAAEVFGRHLLGAAPDHCLELGHRDRDRIFNLGYFTWVEQQGITIEHFVERRKQKFWRDLRGLLPAWDEKIVEFNNRVKAAS